jgi:hypothetical protein
VIIAVSDRNSLITGVSHDMPRYCAYGSGIGAQWATNSGRMSTGVVPE